MCCGSLSLDFAGGRILQEDLTGEKLLLQGVVDCCFMEEDGITVLDFKTDRGPTWGRGGRGPPAMADRSKLMGRR